RPAEPLAHGRRDPGGPRRRRTARQSDHGAVAEVDRVIVTTLRQAGWTMSAGSADEFELFISYAHVDNQGEHAGKVTALVEAIKADYLRFAGTPLKVFFDTDDIRSMDDWQVRILKGLRQSKMMVAILSPAYFASDYCRKEWEHYVE